MTWLKKINFLSKKSDLFSCRQSKYACLHDIMFVDMHFYGWFLCILSIWILILERERKYIICINVCLIWFCRLVPLLSTLYVVSYRHRMPTVRHVRNVKCNLPTHHHQPATTWTSLQTLMPRAQRPLTYNFNDIKLSKKIHYLRLDFEFFVEFIVISFKNLLFFFLNKQQKIWCILLRMNVKLLHKKGKKKFYARESKTFMVKLRNTLVDMVCNIWK